MGLDIGPDPSARTLAPAQPSGPDHARTPGGTSLTDAVAALPAHERAGLDAMTQMVASHLDAIRGGAAPPPNFAGVLAAHDEVLTGLGVPIPDTHADVRVTLAAAHENAREAPSGRAASPPALPDERLEFDGKTLVLRSATPDRIDRSSFPGVSGRPDDHGRFDNSAARQAMPRTGPLPEGVYHIHVSEVQSISTRDQLLGMVGRGAWPGGTLSWGEQRVWIHPGATHTDARSVEAPVPGTDRTVTRDGFSIHGGRTPGSAGCIDLTSRAGAFFGRLSEVSHTGGTIPLYVNYPETPGGPVPR